MATHGASVEEVPPPVPPGVDWTVVREPEAAAYHAPWMAAHAAAYGPEIYDNLVRAAAVPAVDYINAQRTRRQIREETKALLQRVDLIVSPTNPRTAARIGAPHAGFSLSHFTGGHNLTGIPAVSVPGGVDGEGLPIGIMFAARHFNEVTLLRAAHAYEQLTGWHSRRPPV